LSKKISIVIPIHNESLNIFDLIKEIYFNLEGKFIYEIIIIDDGSTDNFIKLFEKSEFKKNIFIIKNNSKMGQSKCIYLGVHKANFENIVTLDGDGQNNPKDISKIADLYFDLGYDLVGGIRHKRKDNLTKIISSKIANSFRDYIFKDNCKDTGCSLKIFNKNTFIKIPYFSGMHRFLPALFSGMNKKTKYVNVDHRPRKFGNSNYDTIGRLIRGIIDLFKVFFIIRNLNK